MTEKMLDFIKCQKRAKLNDMALEELEGLKPYIHMNVGIFILGPKIKELKEKQLTEGTE